MRNVHKLMMALTVLSKNTGHRFLPAQASTRELQNVIILSPDLTTCQQKNRLFPEINKTCTICCIMAHISILKPQSFFDAQKMKMKALKQLQKPRQSVHNKRRKAALCGVPGEDTLWINVRIRKPWVGGNDSSTGSEVTAGGITERAHSLVAAPLMRVCPEEFSVGSSRQSSGRGQT